MSDAETWKVVFRGLVRDERKLSLALKAALGDSAVENATPSVVALRREVGKLAGLAAARDSTAALMAEDIRLRLAHCREEIALTSSALAEDQARIEADIEQLRASESIIAKTHKTLPDEEESGRAGRLHQIDAELEAIGGPTCGWFKDDHDDFIRLCAKTSAQSDEARLAALLRAFPLFSEQRITDHLVAVTRKRELDQEKRQLAAEHLQARRDELVRRAEETKKLEETREAEEARRKRQQQTQQQQLNEQRLRQWELKRVRSAEAEASRKKEQRKRQQEAEEERKRRETAERAAQRQQVEEFRRKKQSERELEEQTRREEEAARPRPETHVVERIREKEEEMVRRRQEKLNERKSAAQRRQSLMAATSQRLAEQYAYVESKLEEQTVTAVGKVVNKFDPMRQPSKHADNFAGVLVRTQGRRLVAWRAGS